MPLTTPVTGSTANHEGAPGERANAAAGLPPSAVAVAEYREPIPTDDGPAIVTEDGGDSTVTTTGALPTPATVFTA
jgi:hypothetical protein